MTRESAVLDLLGEAGRTNPAWAWGEGLVVGRPPSGPTTRTACAIADPDVARVVIAEHADARGLPPGRDAASLVFQRYCHRWCGIATLVWAMTGSVLDVSASRCATTFDGGSPVSAWLDEVRVEDRDGRALVDVLLARHLLPIAHTFREVGRLSVANAWGNAAASMAAGFRFVSRALPADRVLALAESVFDHPKLRTAGSFRVVTDGDRSSVFFDRATCCHWDAVPDGKLCSWCSKRTPEDRAARFAAILRDSP